MRSVVMMRLVCCLSFLLVALVGDFWSYHAETASHVERFVRAATSRRGLFAVRGNWDVWWFPEADLFGGTGVRELDGTAARVVAGESEIWLVGAAVERAHALLPAFERVPEGRFAVLVHHYPETIDMMGGWGADLTLGGDTHGGQVRLPLVGPLVRISRYGRYRDIGLHRVGKAWLYINRGIGMEGGGTPRVRFRCRPEITLIEIVPRERGR